MLQSVTREMEMSNVFAGDEMARTRRLGTEVRGLREKEVQAILRALEHSLAELQARTGHLRTAGEGHRRVADTLSRLAMLIAQAAENAARQAALDKVRALAANVEPLARQVEAGQDLKAQQKAAAEKYGDQARNLAREIAPPEAAKHVDKAGDDLGAKDPVGAKRELDEAVRALQDELDNNNDSLAKAKESAEELRALAEDLKKAREQVDNLDKLNDPNKAADKAMDALVKQDDIKDRLDDAGQKEAEQDVANAMDDTQAGKYEPAGQDLDAARQKVEEQAKALEDQIARAAQEQLNDFKAMQQLADQLQTLDALQNRLDGIKNEQAAALNQPEQPAGQMAPADQQKLAGEMGQLAQDMNQAQLPQAAQPTAQAQQNTQAARHEQAQQKLEEAGQALTQARQQAEQQLAQLEQKIEAGRPLADTAAIEQMQQGLAQLQQQYAQAPPPQQQAMAPQMGQMAQQMQQAALPQAAQAMQQAEQNAEKNQAPAAEQQMEQAQHALAQAHKQAKAAAQAMARQQPKNGPPGPPEPPQPGLEMPTPENAPQAGLQGAKEKHEKNMAATDQNKPRRTASDWRAGLPEKERQALLTARKQPYPPQMEADVKKYYELLAE